jgi:hypothetical protein
VISRQGKAKLSMWLINYAICHEDICGNGGVASLFLTSALDGGEWSASCPEPLHSPRKVLLVYNGLEAGWASELVCTL